MDVPIGEFAALATSVLWAVSSTFFTIGGKGHSHHVVNRMRLLGALILLGIPQMILLGTLVPDESLYVWLLLGLSGIVGLAIGDGFLLVAYKKVGPRISMLLMSMAPVVTVTAGWVFWGERLNLFNIGAIILVLTGVSYVVLEKKKDRSPFKITPIGLAFGIGAMLGQAIQHPPDSHLHQNSLGNRCDLVRFSIHPGKDREYESVEGQTFRHLHRTGNYSRSYTGNMGILHCS